MRSVIQINRSIDRISDRGQGLAGMDNVRGNVLTHAHLYTGHYRGERLAPIAPTSQRLFGECGTERSPWAIPCRGLSMAPTGSQRNWRSTRPTVSVESAKIR